MFSNPPTSEIRSILTESKTIAVVGISDREDRASKYVSEYMQREGYTIYPVNPRLDEWNGLKVYDSVAEVPAQIDIVNVFRRSSEVLPPARDAVVADAKVLWLQQGIFNEQAADIVDQAGIRAIMNSCIMVEHKSMKLGF
ncbi:CoA-binding protein [Candidatus Lucifugimonas marina]|jgi:predicted CoA-binding protein|uniref:CoA-binding protein n=1 Tax=Candidatus Lucifugimonas marina TaxID=3038979 RepID=A0AAJ5ZGD1_9CHLR|nr:CoA-binding protein [SAR202 cluster bacterium JH702]MDG0869634.1 CoA-binding protein [SAR202 cluster bacterium JH639]WFG34367.1 CoA-binding protein [SAR202 cluster bacterium JH545]WFG38296.1 CoA-binding protein [SAR202 cluster bacterium JH1073]